MRCAIVFSLSILLGIFRLEAQTDEQKVDQIFAAFDKPNSPGCALGVIKDGAFVYRKGYGLGSMELDVPLSSRSVFYMASVSKQFTAASVVLAAEQGFFSLDDDVHKYIPQLPDYGHPVMLRQMLHHTSGLRDYFSLLTLSGESPYDVHSTAEMVGLVARQKALNFTPGAEFLYSNTNYLLLAEVVHRTTKMPLSEFAAVNIFQPLGMRQTRFYDDRSVVVPGRVPAYEPGKDGSFVLDWSTNFDLVGDGGLMTSVDDLLLWDRNFYKNVLGKGTLLQEMSKTGVLNNGKSTGYALGLVMGSYRGLPIVEHSGGLFGYRTNIIRFPKQQFTVVCLCNVGNANPPNLSRKVADIYLKKKPMPEEGARPQKDATKVKVLPLDANALAAYAGSYASVELDTIYKLSAESGYLLLRIRSNPPMRLIPAARDEFRGDLGVMTFQRDASGHLAGMSLSDGRVQNISFQKTD